MTEEEKSRGQKTRRALSHALLGWAGLFVLVNFFLGAGIVTQDWRTTRIAFLANLAATPIALFAAYNETRSAWDGRDRELQTSLAGLGVIAAVLGLSFLI